MNIPFGTTDWEEVEVTEHRGETGIAYWRTRLYENIRIRLVEYSSGYKANHWCGKGHIVYCLEGDFISHLQDGQQYHLKKGMSYQVTDDLRNPHLSTSDAGCLLWIIDGEFLKSDENM